MAYKAHAWCRECDDGYCLDDAEVFETQSEAVQWAEENVSDGPSFAWEVVDLSTNEVVARWP